ncbi:MAG TPA: NAD(P)-dependent oxidoreductase [Parvularculaceae bacterium]|nr:NAD(P)-dependent oxidoreductase [Parvularculaceae bacterium]
MLKFTDLDRKTPSKRASDARLDDFREIYADFDPAEARAQSARCSQCGVPFCQNHCPLTNDIPEWLRLAAEGRLKDAYALSSATNSMPEICGRICPQDRLCEGVCVIEQSKHGAVTIGAVEQFITETAWTNGWVEPIKTGAPRGRSVGIVGAGPAGLSAAEELRKAGVEVVIYDRHDRAGGLLVYGIPNFKLEKDVVARRIRRLEEAGVAFRLNFEIGRDANLNNVRDRHDAILIAAGVYKGRDLDIEGEDAAGVVKALDYLTASNRKGLGDVVPAFDDGRLNASGKRVVVIGGGDTAMDCVRTAVRQGAESVTCLYRRDRANMPGSARETANAEEEGVVFEWLAAPSAIESVMGRATGVYAVRMRISEKDATGRRSVEPVDGSEFRLAADLVIKALGFEAEDLPALFGAPELKFTSRGVIATRPGSLETRLPDVFAAGDIVRGASLVVWAIVDGRRAAAEIIERLSSKTTTLLAAE